jgi:hypothetical protein
LEEQVHQIISGSSSNLCPQSGTAGTANTGGGGGAGSPGDPSGFAGGSGIVIVKQYSSGPYQASGVWSLQCQYNFKKQGTWTPSATLFSRFFSQ